MTDMTDRQAEDDGCDAPMREVSLRRLSHQPSSSQQRSGGARRLAAAAAAAALLPPPHLSAPSDLQFAMGNVAAAGFIAGFGHGVALPDAVFTNWDDVAAVSLCCRVSARSSELT